jgi:hypothetical protein
MPPAFECDAAQARIGRKGFGGLSGVAAEAMLEDHVTAPAACVMNREADAVTLKPARRCHAPQAFRWRATP